MLGKGPSRYVAHLSSNFRSRSSSPQTKKGSTLPSTKPNNLMTLSIGCVLQLADADGPGTTKRGCMHKYGGLGPRVPK